ncbi:MAG: hypothetical protein ACI4DV_07745 [Lachnospiraceae bacterium]
MENKEPYSFQEITVGSQIRFYYKENEIQISGDIMFLIDEIGAVYWENGNDITATILWKNTGEFVLTDFRSRNRNLDFYVEEALKEAYGVKRFLSIDIRYDSSKMNEETLSVTAKILLEGSASNDYAELKMTRSDEYFHGYWEIVDLKIRK